MRLLPCVSAWQSRTLEGSVYLLLVFPLTAEAKQLIRMAISARAVKHTHACTLSYRGLCLTLFEGMGCKKGWKKGGGV